MASPSACFLAGTTNAALPHIPRDCEIIMNRKINMNRQVIKAPYTAPLVEPIAIAQPLHLLVSVSVEAGIEDWEEGDEL